MNENGSMVAPAADAAAQSGSGPEALSSAPGWSGTLTGIQSDDLSMAGMVWVSDYLVPAIAGLLMLIVTYFAAKLTARWVSAAVCRRVDNTLGKFAGRFTFYAMLALAGPTILPSLGVSVTSCAALIAAAGFAIGLAFQGTLSNFAAGILLLVFRPFKVGDFVNMAGVMGKVNEIDLFTTTLDTPDNRRLIVPNSSVAGTTIENITYHRQRRVDVVVGVSYSADLQATRNVLTACAEAMGDRTVQGVGRGYQVLLTNLGASSVEWTIRVWVASENFFAVKEALITQIKQQLDLHGLEIPFPQMQLHIRDSGHRLDSISDPHRTLPIPKLADVGGEQRGVRVRPRARGESSGV